ncbi:AAA family ATPase [Cyclobacterium sp. 1_MG-2023]|uniref:AAA family ATPase n=1 Tax=Cyclobacterium sp. 1_MG-2023 TaxID=3062681 RepID=UPI0026E2EC6A|nr:AAA family ATPase [Cyclobacterium sp. 1_MG-2023]MDO6440481.1 AAA family ATPase [Cyclobacterium sp. 1_MG-2023]
MSDKGSVFQKGGGGTNFEQLVQTAFMTTLIIRGKVPCIPLGELSEVAMQVTNRGYETDDFMATAKSASGKHRLLVQVKHDISFTADNDKFKEVINAFWKDYNNTSIFDKTRDKLLVVKNGLTKDERNHLKSLFNWAVNHATETDFHLEVNRIKAKKKRLDVFRSVLKEANNNTDLTDKEIWEFLKCVDVLEYDFLHEGSIDKAYFFNLIKLSRSKNSTATESEIWNNIFSYASTLNKDGGSATLESIKDKDFFQHFDNAQLSPFFKAVEKLKSDSKEILRPIKTSIGKGENEFQLRRTEARENILQAISDSQFTIVTGKPGVGKSAEIKEIIQKDFPNASVFVFRADQFNESTLANVFSSQGVNETIQDIFSCISLIAEKIIFIDSLEKLLEADPECAFKQLLALLEEHPEIKIIASSRKYAIDLITLKFGINKNETTIIDIPTLNEAELKLVSEKFPQLHNILKNDKVKKLLQSPKYLDFSILAIGKSNDDYANVSLTEFKDKLWNSLVVDSTNTRNGLPIKREEAFKEIAVKRAKEMKLFTKPDKSDAEAIACLENDEIVFQENNNRKYSPTHDILEDWALVKYVSSKFEENPKPQGLFSSLGNEPAIRRAFRLWIEDYLIDNSSKINELIKATFSDKTIEKYWADELLIAVFKSENSSSFFTAFEKELLEDNATFFNRCLHIIKTCCKETDQNTNTSSLLLPIGSGWKEAMFFIQKNITQLEQVKLSILNFLSDWYYRLLFQYKKIENAELEASKSIVLIYLKEIEEEKDFWQEENAKDKSSNLISILFDLASISKEEIKQLITRAFSNKENRESWRLNSFYKNVIESCLSGIGNQRLIIELPELIIDAAWKNWKYIPPKESDYPDEIRFLSRNSLRDEKCWGIRDKQSFFPSGIYKTPFYNLLWVHPIVGLKFIIDFINYSVEFYVSANCEYKHKIHHIELEQNDGTKTKLSAAWELWAAYRGSSVTNYALESLLMSFEKFLLETAKRKSEVSKENLKYIFDYVLKNTNNVAPLSVLTSVAIAYPEEVEEAMLPLLSVKEFYDWDLNRALQERSVLAPMDNRISFAQKERWESNQLPHRNQYQRGLGDFIVNYQFNVRKLNQQIHNLFDKLKASIKDDDLMWKKRLNEIDIRNWEVQPYDEKLGGLVVQPKYEKEVVEHLASSKDYIDKQNKTAEFSGIISKAYKKEVSINFEKWTECYQYYSNSENFDILFSKPITLAIVGLSEFSNDISEEQKNWCLETIVNAIGSILQDTFSRDYSLNMSVNLMEKEIALSSFHLLMQNVNNDDDRNGIIATMIYMLFAPFPDHEIDKITQYVREVFFKQFPDEAKRVWLGLIKYSNYKKSNPNHYGNKDEENLKKENEFVQQIASDINSKLDLTEISLEKSEGYLLARALVITPYDTIDKEFTDFINHILPIVLGDLTKEEDYSYNRNRESRQFHHESISDIEQYFASLFLEANFDFSKSVLTTMVNSLSKDTPRQSFGRDDLLQFVNTTLDYFVLKLYDNGNLKIDQTKYSLQQTNFWNLWEVLFDLIPSDGKHPLIQKLLLDIRYLLWDYQGNPNEKSWNVLNGKKEFYKKMFLEKGISNASSVINVFSTIGGKEFLPEGISWLTDVFKLKPIASLSLTSVSSNRMIKGLFYNHISKIKNDKTLIEDYVWILNRMVDLGSSEAYLFRENVITYKSLEN